MYKVLITTSGTGSRLGELTKYTNKALVRIGKKPAISYIVEAYPTDIEIVVTLGYFGNHVREFLLLAYPERTFTFVTVDPFEGEGSSLGYSMLQAQDVLMCPFIFHSCDTIVVEPIPVPEKNWIGGYMVGTQSTDLNLAQYRTHKIVDNKVVSLKEKGDPDFESIHIGLIGIYEYKNFWNALTDIYTSDPLNTGHSDVHVISAMLDGGFKFDLVPYTSWYDTGNPTALEKTRNVLGQDFRILDKADESIFIFDTFVIKFFANSLMVASRVKRAQILHGLVPEVIDFKKNFYKYTYISGDLYSRVVDTQDFKKFLSWTKEHLWIKNECVSKDVFESACLTFYKEKTVERVKKFLSKKGFLDRENVINGVEVPHVQKMLDMLNFNKLCTHDQYRIHGDFILDNIIKTKTGYSLLDWRQDFGGLIEVGDIYYDLAKMNHNLTVNHDIINENCFEININKNVVECRIDGVQTLKECKMILKSFVIEHGFDWNIVEILTGIIWLNMSALHHDPFDTFLFYFGKLQLWNALNQQT